jgi:hypothetical protein
LAIRTSALKLCNRVTGSARPIRLLSAPCLGPPASTRTVARAREQASTTPTTSLPSWNATSRRLVAGETAGSSPSGEPAGRLPLSFRVAPKQKPRPARLVSLKRPVVRDCRSDRRETRAAGSPQRQHRFRRPRALPHSAGARLQVSTNTANGRRLGECRSAWLSDSLAAGRDPSAPSRQERHRAALLPHSQAEGAVRRDCRPGQPILVGLLVWSTTWTPSMLCSRLCGVDAWWDAFFLLSAF